MNTRTIDIQEAATRWIELLAMAGKGDEIIVTSNNTPLARIVPFSQDAPRIPGLSGGMISTSDDFDEPLPESFWAGQS